MPEWTKQRDIAWPISLAGITVATRVLFTSRLLYHMDSVQFALALDEYNPRVHQPHPPGYFLYVMLGRIFHLFIGDANLVFVSMNIAFSALTVVGLYWLGEELFGRDTGILAAAIAITSPVFWFHGEVALSYAADAFFSTALALLCWRVYKGDVNYLWLSACLLGIAGGVRQNTLVFLLPFWLFSARRAGGKKMILATGILGITVFLWFVPMIIMSGGWESYRKAFDDLWQYTFASHTILSRAWAVKIYVSALSRFTLYGLFGGLFTLAFSAYALVRSGAVKSFDRDTAAFLAFWILSPVLFYLVIGINPANPGYALIFLPGLFVLAACSVRYAGGIFTKISKTEFFPLLAVALITVNAGVFLFGGSAVSLKQICMHDRYLATVLAGVRSFSPQDTVVIAFPSIFFGFRDLMYYLPEYRTYQVGVKTPGGAVRQSFRAFGRRTLFPDRALRLPPSVRRFVAVLFDEDRHKLDGIPGIKWERAVPGLFIASGPAGKSGAFLEKTVMPLLVEEMP